MLYDVFISYARDDEAKAREYYEYLESIGVRCWYDQLAPSGENVFEHIALAIHDSNFVLLLWSQNAFHADFVKNEIAIASTLGKNIIPVKLDNSRYSPGVGLILGKPDHKPEFVDGRVKMDLSHLKTIASRILPASQKEAPVFACLNMKGGVGKTTVAANLAGAFHDAQYGFKKSVLLVDMDAQANLSTLLVENFRYDECLARDRSVVSCFENSLATGSQKSPTNSLFEIDPTGTPPKATLLAYNLKNPIADQRLDLLVGQFDLFKYSLTSNYPALEACKERFLQFMRAARFQYDVIIVDAAPSNSFVTECVIASCTDIIAPTTPDKYALRGLRAVKRFMEAGMTTTPARPIHVLRNGVERDPTSAEEVILREYQLETLTARFRDSRYFQTRNPDPDKRVRNPLADLAYARGDTATQSEIKKACEQLLGRIS